MIYLPEMKAILRPVSAKVVAALERIDAGEFFDPVIVVDAEPPEVSLTDRLMYLSILSEVNSGDISAAISTHVAPHLVDPNAVSTMDIVLIRGEMVYHLRVPDPRTDPDWWHS
jgi:hypothetical protein